MLGYNEADCSQYKVISILTQKYKVTVMVDNETTLTILRVLQNVGFLSVCLFLILVFANVYDCPDSGDGLGDIITDYLECVFDSFGDEIWALVSFVVFISAFFLRWYISKSPPRLLGQEAPPIAYTTVSQTS